MHFKEFQNVESEFKSLFSTLARTQERIRKELEAYADGKVLKGNELVGWLGEIYTKIIFSGRMVDDSFEHDVETSDGLRISVKTRKGTRSAWTRSSAIPKIEGTDCPTHLCFVHLDNNYSVSSIWHFPWSYLLDTDRFRKHMVRGNFRSYYMNVNPSRDEEFKIYG